MRRRTIELAFTLTVTMAMASAALAQPQPPQGRGPGPGQPALKGQVRGEFVEPGGQHGPGRPGERGDGPPPGNNRGPGLPGGTWWRNADTVQRLALNSDQQKKIDDTFQQHRLKLVDLDATLRKEEITMEPLMAADSPDEAKSLAQIDKVAQARAELEKANARFLFAVRRVLTPDQWKKLQESSRNEGGPGHGGPGGPGGRGGPGRGRGE